MEPIIGESLDNDTDHSGYDDDDNDGNHIVDSMMTMVLTLMTLTIP